MYYPTNLVANPDALPTTGARGMMKAMMVHHILMSNAISARPLLIARPGRAAKRGAVLRAALLAVAGLSPSFS